MNRKTWIQTYSGVAFNLVSPSPDDVLVEDIAHHLSRLCRFTGATQEHYSVAQHCYMVSFCVAPHLALQGLMHDAHEAYIGDVSAPLKRAGLAQVLAKVEGPVWAAVATRFDLPFVLDPAVKEADLRMLSTERRLLGPEPKSWQLDAQPYAIDLVPWCAEVAKEKFLWRFEDLWMESEKE